MFVQIVTDPWFWAFLSTFGWGLACGVIGTKTLGGSLAFGIFMFVFAELPRVLLPLPFVSQPRISPNPPWLALSGLAILLMSLFFGTTVFRIAPLTGPDRRERLRTDGLYAIVRHPLMLCDIFWPLGWAIIQGSVIGILLTPVWLFLISVLTFVEEETLVREYGQAYIDFQLRVPRLIPHFPGYGRRHTNRQ